MKKVILFLSVMTLFLSSCEIFSSLSEKTGAISIKMPEGSERIAETYDVNEITSFTAELYDSGSSPVAKVSSAPGKSITFESLTPGSYAIVIKAFISEECAGYAEKSGIVVEAGATTYETITLFKNIIKNIESVEIAKESFDKITKNYTVGQTFALPDNVSIIAHFIHGYEKELEPNDYEIYICNAEKYTEETLVENQPLSENSRFAVIGICTESGYKYSAPVSLVMNAEEPVVTWKNLAVKDNAISFELSATASGDVSYTWQKSNTADMAEKTDCEIEISSDGTVTLPLTDNGAYVYYVCTVTNTNKDVNGTKTASKQTDVFGGELKSFTAKYTGKYETPGQLEYITAFEITETYADDSVLNIQSLPVNYKLAYAENLSNPEQLVGNIPLVITNLAAFDADGKNLTYEVTVPFKYSFAEDDLAFEITADGGKQENETITIAQYSGIITLSASNSLPAYMLYDGENNASTAIENTVSYAWYNSSSETIDSKIGNLENDATYYCEQTITSSEPEWYVSSEPVKKSIEIKTEPWIIEVRKSEDDGTVEGSLDAGEYTLSCTNSCASENETIVYSINPKGIVTLDENNGFTVNQQSNEVTITISLSIDGKVVATKEYTIPKQGTYIVTFETNGGSAVASQTIVDNGTATTPTAPTKTGYTFAGWYTDAGCTNSYDFLAAVTENITLYAKWTINTYTVTFNTDGGSAVDSQTVNYNSTATTPTAPTKTGYTFAGWYTDAGCTNSYDFLAAVTENITLYAKWTINTYTVTFNTDGGSAVDSQTVNYNSTATTPTAPTKTGYTFAGWYTDAGCTNSYDFLAAVTENITLYAKWTINTYTVTFNTDGGSAVDSQTVNYNSTATTPTAPTKTGYTFAGWYTDTECTVEYKFSEVVTENITLYAKWIEVITDWKALSEKLNNAATDEDLGDIYISGDFDVDSEIIFSGTANIISTGAGATFKRSGSSSDVYDIFYLNPDSMTFKGSETAPIVFDGTYTTERSNLITNMGTTTFEYCSFKNNSSSSYASVYLMEKYTSSNTTFRFCSFTGNKGPKGGAVYVGDGDKVCFENCRFENNTSSSDGGAVYIKASATATFSDCIFGSAEYENLGNSCTGSIGGGGAVYATGASITLSNCEFYYNKATGDSGNGGAIGADSSSTVTITEGCIFKNNEIALVDSSSTHGGALYINKSSLVLPNSGNIFENNKEGNKTEHIFSDIYIVSSGTLGTVNGTVYANGSYTVAENGSLTSTSTSQ